MSPADPIVGVMAKAPIAGRCKTRLARTMGEDGAARLYAAMLADTLDALGRVPAVRRVVLAAPEDDGVAHLGRIVPSGWEVVPQRGPDLGARLVAAFDLFGANGPVVLFGGDSPTLPLGPVESALASFQGPRKLLLGPCHDGGYYLVGLTTPEPEIFSRIPWSTSRVFEETMTRARGSALDCTVLPAWYDVDEPADLERLRTELAAEERRAPRTAALLRR